MLQKAQWGVLVTNTSMADFVTSSDALMLWNTEEACQEYIASSEQFHPKRFRYQVLDPLLLDQLRFEKKGRNS